MLNLQEVHHKSVYHCRELICSRGKKCDEAWNELGKCERCLNGGLECHGKSEPVKRTRRVGPRQSSDSSHKASPSLPSHTGSYHPSPHSFFNANASSPSVSNLRSTHTSSIPTGASDYGTTPTSLNPAFILPTANPVPLTPLDTSDHQFDWLKDGHSEPFAFLNTSFDGSLNVDSVPQWNQNSFWDDFGSFLVPQTNMSPFDPTTSGPLESRLLYVTGTTDNPMRRGVSLAEICTSYWSLQS